MDELNCLSCTHAFGIYDLQNKDCHVYCKTHNQIIRKDNNKLCGYFSSMYDCTEENVERLAWLMANNFQKSTPWFTFEGYGISLHVPEANPNIAVKYLLDKIFSVVSEGKYEFIAIRKNYDGYGYRSLVAQPCATAKNKAGLYPVATKTYALDGFRVPTSIFEFVTELTDVVIVRKIKDGYRLDFGVKYVGYGIFEDEPIKILKTINV